MDTPKPFPYVSPVSTAKPLRGTIYCHAECEWCGRIIERKGTGPWTHAYPAGKRECA